MVSLALSGVTSALVRVVVRDLAKFPLALSTGASSRGAGCVSSAPRAGGFITALLPTCRPRSCCRSVIQLVLCVQTGGSPSRDGRRRADVDYPGSRGVIGRCAGKRSPVVLGSNRPKISPSGRMI
ncbi:hypothetical protein SKAU_G00201220 [Synaphobranchus kaupii]|uniref:Uncharacterized protein n=1 Tax=Synaphobranchus kaupii TaxID=118154 RepID=A0A9Q1FFZ9_SYNKA|nr:hypothetical protein SKAU_G00201220 [Synaphobranchus kaupii]